MSPEKVRGHYSPPPRLPSVGKLNRGVSFVSVFLRFYLIVLWRFLYEDLLSSPSGFFVVSGQAVISQHIA